ncbi:MAG: tetratricopeptide repeat protein [Nitrospirae bacterium]|nr:tetratricopeptide repeat protein [Nitrospirota bacterium]
MALDKNTILNNAQRYAARGQIEKAIEEWQKLIHESPNDANIYNTIGDLYLKNNSIQEAVSAYLKAGEIFYRAGFALKTIALYKKVNKIAPENIEVYLKLGGLNAERGLIGNARDDYLRAARLYIKLGHNKQAVAVYKKIAELEPENISVHQKIAEMCLKEGLKRDAAEEYSTIAEIYLRQNDIKEAEVFYNHALSNDRENKRATLGIGTLRLKQDKLQDGINILEDILEKRPDDVNTLNLFIDAALKSGDYEKVEKSLRHLISLEPANIAHRERLGYAYLKKGVFENAISEFRVVLEDYNQKQEYDKIKKIIQDILQIDNKNIDAHRMLIDVYEKTGNEGGKITEYLAIADIYVEQAILDKAENIYKEVLKIDPDNIEAKRRLDEISVKEEAKKESPKATIEAEKPPLKEAPIEKPAGVVLQPFPKAEEKALSDEDAEKVEGYYTEADVYLKYGLTNKSIEQLELILAIKPDELKAHKKLKDIFKIEGNTNKAVDECIVISKLYEEKGDIKRAEDILREALEIDQQNEMAIRRLNNLSEPSPAQPVQIKKPQQEITSEIEKSIPTVELSDMDLEGITPFISEERDEGGKPSEEEIEHVVSEIPIIEPVDIQQEVTEAPPEIPQAASKVEYPEYSGNINERLAEADFYAQQGLILEAQNIYERILSDQPDNIEVKEKLDSLISSVKKLEKGMPISEIKKEGKITEKKGPTSFKVFEKEDVGDDAFFDLTEELKGDIAAATEASPSKELRDMELSDIFHEFKKGVKEYLKDEDYETHYNLGIAYREMGLINEAIGEFQLAIKGPERFFDASSMLALCFKEKGMHQLAINQLKRAIDDPRYNESEFLSLKYDLGVIYEEIGQTGEAYNAFMDAYAVDVNFRDVAEKIDMLKGGKPLEGLKKAGEDGKLSKASVDTEKAEIKIDEKKAEIKKPIASQTVETAAGSDSKKGKKGRISYI